MTRREQWVLVVAFVTGMCVVPFVVHKMAEHIADYAPPPTHIRFCGIENRPCQDYTVTFRLPSAIDEFGISGTTDCDSHTITVYRHVPLDRFYDVSTLKHEAYHALMCEHDFTLEEQSLRPMSAHDWIYMVETWDTMMLHDNPELVEFLRRGY